MNTIIKNPQRQSAVFGASDPSPQSYKGVERRRAHRRAHNDRRVEMRFEMDKVDRRICAGRRADDKRVNFW